VARILPLTIYLIFTCAHGYISVARSLVARVVVTSGSPPGEGRKVKSIHE